MSEKYNLFVDSLVFLFLLLFYNINVLQKHKKKTNKHSYGTVKICLWESFYRRKKKFERIKRDQKKKTSHVNKKRYSKNATLHQI